MEEVSFDVRKEERELILLIVQRAMDIASQAGDSINRLDLEMDLTACHANGNPLRLADLLSADLGDFGHDVFGIHLHINREDGSLMDCFSPRYSERETASSIG